MFDREIVFGRVIGVRQCVTLRNADRSGTRRILDGSAVPNALTLRIEDRCLGSRLLDMDPHALHDLRHGSVRRFGREAWCCVSRSSLRYAVVCGVALS